MKIPRMLSWLRLPALTFGAFCIFTINCKFSANAQTSLQGSDANNREIINSIFKRSVKPTPDRDLFNKTASFSNREAFTRKKAHTPAHAQGWNKRSDLVSIRSTSLNIATDARLPNSRSAFANRSANLQKNSLPVPQPTNVNFKPAAGFSTKIEPREYRGRLPTEAVQALEQIKQRELSIEEVRALLNKHQRPE